MQCERLACEVGVHDRLVVQVRLREPEAFQLNDVKATSFAEVAERARALQVNTRCPSRSTNPFHLGLLREQREQFSA